MEEKTSRTPELSLEDTFLIAVAGLPEEDVRAAFTATGPVSEPTRIGPAPGSELVVPLGEGFLYPTDRPDTPAHILQLADGAIDAWWRYRRPADRRLVLADRCLYDTLVDLAVGRGTVDNVTVVMARYAIPS